MFTTWSFGTGNRVHYKRVFVINEVVITEFVITEFVITDFLCIYIKIGLRFPTDGQADDVAVLDVVNPVQKGDDRRKVDKCIYSG